MTPARLRETRMTLIDPFETLTEIAANDRFSALCKALHKAELQTVVKIKPMTATGTQRSLNPI